MTTAGEQGVARRVLDAFHEGTEQYLEEVIDRVLRADIPFYRSLPREAIGAAIRRVHLAVGEDLERGAPMAFPALLAALGTQRSAMGVAVSEMLAGMNIGFEKTSEEFARRFADDPEARIFWELARARIAYSGAAALADAYLAAREKVVRAQSDEIVRLSTQVLPLYRGILVFPLVGSIDAARAQDIVMVLLAAIQKHRTQVVLIDISGLARVDAEVAMHLTRAAQAVGLLGAQAILVGMSPDLARTMIAAGLDLGRLRTLADLESGLLHALALVGKRVCDR